MLDRPYRGSRVRKLMCCIRVLVPFSLEAVHFVIEIGIVDVYFVRVDADDRAYECNSFTLSPSKRARTVNTYHTADATSLFSKDTHNSEPLRNMIHIYGSRQLALALGILREG